MSESFVLSALWERVNREIEMTVDEIKAIVDKGYCVHWVNPGYKVIKDKLGQYLIEFGDGKWYCGLTTQASELNGNEAEFYVATFFGEPIRYFNPIAATISEVDLSAAALILRD